jgi:hypothetical protein
MQASDDDELLLSLVVEINWCLMCNDGGCDDCDCITEAQFDCPGRYLPYDK